MGYKLCWSRSVDCGFLPRPMEIDIAIYLCVKRVFTTLPAIQNMVCVDFI